MSGMETKSGTEVGGKAQTTYVVPPDASKNSTSAISMSEWLQTKRRLASQTKPGTLTVLTRTGSG